MESNENLEDFISTKERMEKLRKDVEKEKKSLLEKLEAIKKIHYQFHENEINERNNKDILSIGMEKINELTDIIKSGYFKNNYSDEKAEMVDVLVRFVEKKQNGIVDLSLFEKVEFYHKKYCRGVK